MSETAQARAGCELILTAAALERLRALLDESGDTHCRLRIRAEGPEDDRTFTFSREEREAPDDVELDYGLVTVVLDRESHARLRDHEVDHRDDERGERFVIRHAR